MASFVIYLTHKWKSHLTYYLAKYQVLIGQLAAIEITKLFIITATMKNDSSHENIFLCTTSYYVENMNWVLIEHIATREIIKQLIGV